MWRLVKIWNVKFQMLQSSLYYTYFDFCLYSLRINSANKINKTWLKLGQNPHLVNIFGETVTNDFRVKNTDACLKWFEKRWTAICCPVNQRFYLWCIILISKPFSLLSAETRIWISRLAMGITHWETEETRRIGSRFKRILATRSKNGFPPTQ